MADYKVIRAHEGDKSYKVGDTRSANPNEVSHLVGTCLEKMADKPENKMAGKVKNKAAK